MSKKISRDVHFSEHTIDTKNNDLVLKNDNETIISSQKNSTSIDDGSLSVKGGVGIKKDLNVGGDIDCDGSLKLDQNLEVLGSSTMDDLTVDDLTIQTDVTFPSTEIFINKLKVTDINVNGSLTLNEDKHIGFQGEELYSGRRFFGWQSFTFAKGEALNALHPYSFKNQSGATDAFFGTSAHVIKEPSSSTPVEYPADSGNFISDNVSVAGIDEEGIYMPVARDQNTVVTASVVLELCLNTYFSTSGATNIDAKIFINSVTLLFKDSDNHSSISPSKTFCRVDIVKRESLLLPGDLEIAGLNFFSSSDLANNSISAHILDLEDPLQITIGNFIGNIATLRVSLFNVVENNKNGPTFIGAYVSYSVNQITPS